MPVAFRVDQSLLVRASVTALRAPTLAPFHASVLLGPVPIPDCRWSDVPVVVATGPFPFTPLLHRELLGVLYTPLFLCVLTAGPS